MNYCEDQTKCKNGVCVKLKNDWGCECSEGYETNFNDIKICQGQFNN